MTYIPNGKTKAWSKGMEFVERHTCQKCGSKFYAPTIQDRRGGGKFCCRDCYTAVQATDPKRFPRSVSRRGNGGTREDLGMYFRSTWEANWARYLNWLQENGAIAGWKYECETFEFHKIKRGSRFYTPDFTITENNGKVVRHEVKGWMDQRSATKMRRMALYYPEIHIEIIDKKRYAAVAQDCCRFIKNWETYKGKPCKPGPE